VVQEGVIIEVVEAPVAVSALQTAVQWALTTLVFAAVLVQTGDNTPTKKKKDEKPERHSGVLQVQGEDIEKSPPDLAAVSVAGYTFAKDTLSWGWSQPVPLGGLTALQRLSGFLPLMSSSQIGRRAQAFRQASQYIKNAMVAGGTGPVSKSFNANDPRVPDARVDIAVYTGLAFVPAP
jgi:hypothetical protein